MNREDALGKFFRGLAESGHYGQLRVGTRQGTYLAAPSGKFLASNNDQDAQATLKTIERALAQWQKLNEADKVAPKELRSINDLSNVSRKSSAQLPEGGYQLDVTLRKFFPRPLRDKPYDDTVIENSGIPPFLAQRLKNFSRQKSEKYWEVVWNEDHAWFTKAEMNKFLPTTIKEGTIQR